MKTRLGCAPYFTLHVSNQLDNAVVMKMVLSLCAGRESLGNEEEGYRARDKTRWRSFT